MWKWTRKVKGMSILLMEQEYLWEYRWEECFHTQFFGRINTTEEKTSFEGFLNSYQS